MSKLFLFAPIRIDFSLIHEVSRNHWNRLQMLSKYYFLILYDKTTDEKLDHFGSFRNLSELFHDSFLDDTKENISINIWN